MLLLLLGAVVDCNRGEVGDADLLVLRSLSIANDLKITTIAEKQRTLPDQMHLVKIFEPLEFYNYIYNTT